jgi:hypothetical protein
MEQKPDDILVEPINLSKMRLDTNEFDTMIRARQPQDYIRNGIDLYHSGIRPSQATGSAGQLDSVKYHLEDMRRLVFDNNNKENK